MTDFFISYTGVDRTWAEWIAWQLEAAGYTTVLQAWDFRPGANFALAMQQAIAESDRTIAVLSPAYLQSGFTAAEWAAAFARDPTGTQGLLLPVRIHDCELQGLLPQIVYIDLVGLDAEAARETLLAGVQRQRAKPSQEPGFPGPSPRPVTVPPLFPGASSPTLKIGRDVSYMQRNRSQMLDKVRLTWITGFLEPSLSHLTRLELGLETQPDVVERPFDLLVQRPAQAPQALPRGTPLSHIFQDAGHTLLILGEPGAGKTTILLELTRDLLDRAVQDESHLIPVVFNLSSWAEHRGALADWLVDELNKRYDVPRKLAQAWVEADVILPLLDGLDEVATGHREACVETINTFLHEHGLVPLVVCSRVADYEALAVRLRVPSAVMIQALSRQQVASYVDQADIALAGLRTALQNDETLWELLNTPLMLSIAALAYKGRSADEISSFGTVEERRAQLFAAYTSTMFQRRAKATLYTRKQTEHWLTWLARAMKDHSQSIFYVERIQPNWVTDQRQQRTIKFIRKLILSVFFGVPLIGMLSVLEVDNGVPISFLAWQFGMCSVFGLLMWLLQYYCPPVGRLLARPVSPKVYMSEEIKCIEKIRWSWSAVRFKRLMLFGPLTAGLLGMLLVVLLRGLDAWSDGLAVGLFFGLLGGLVVGVVWLWTGVTIGEIALHSFPNEGIKRSLQNGLRSGLAGGLVFGLLGGLLSGLAGGLVFGLFGGLLSGLVFGGYSCLYHFALRLVLWRKNFAPLNYVRFLDCATARIFLRKVGGGYVFVHRILLDYFAAMPQPSDEGQNCNTNG